MNKKYYPRFAKRLGIVTMTSMIALFSLLVVGPNIAGFAYAQSTSAQIQSLLAQVSKLKSAVQAQSNQISQLSAALRAGAGPSLSTVTKIGPVVTVPAGKIVESHVDCPVGSVPTGGGSDTGADPGDPRLQFIQSGPFTSHGFTATGWKAAEFNPTTTNLFFVVVQCATVTQGTSNR